jgi:hypothetical protein
VEDELDRRFLDFAIAVGLGARMRRMLRVRAAFEPTRCSEEQLQLAYEQVVQMVRRAYARGDHESPMSPRADERTGSSSGKVGR